MRRPLPLLLLAIVLLAPCLPARSSPAQAESNPFFTEWKTPFGVPPFAEIRPEHFLPAFQEAIRLQKAEVAAIAANPEPATFANTVVALDETGELNAKVGAVFNNLSSAETNERLQAISREVAPMLASLRDDTLLNEPLFARVKAVWEKRAELGLDPEQAMLLEKTWKNFVRGGANLDAPAKERLRAINKELSLLGLRFGENLLRETNAFQLLLERREELAGLPESVAAGAAQAAAAAGQPGKWLFTLQAPSIWPFLQFSADRGLRRRILDAYAGRCDRGDAADNKATLVRIADLRAEKARLLGFATWADFVLDENMAKTPAGVYRLLDRLWRAAVATSRREAEALQAMIRQEGGDFALEPADWRYYTEKVRKARFDLDDLELRPYFALERVRDGAFTVANRLYGITFTPRPDIPVYHPEVRAFEVRDADGSHLGVFLTDYHPRPGKRGGAWSSAYRGQYVQAGREVRPVVVNVCNFTRPTGAAPALLSLEEVATLFHELGHGLHQLLARTRYRGVRGTPRDFVELPSQIMENWALEPEVLQFYARHWQSGAVIPPALVAKIRRAETFNQGFETVEYLAASYLDMAWHTRAEAGEADAGRFEKAALEKIALPPQILPRYRSVYFQHVFGPGGGYSAGYYSYIWADVLVADAYQAFREKGIFDPGTASAFRRHILEKGGSEEAMSLYRRFRGRDPQVEPLLLKRGLREESAAEPGGA